MKLKDFVVTSNLLAQTELSKIALLAYYYLKKDNIVEFNTANIIEWLVKLNLATPNMSRLQKNIEKSRQFIKGKTPKSFKLHAKELARLETEYPQLNQRDEEVTSTDTIIPEKIFISTRGYIENLTKQINASYENNIFDGCAVLMRRLLEILLIHSYEKLGIASEIKDRSGNYMLLEGIASNAKSNNTLNLSRNTKGSLDDYRKLGNYSAHKIHYNCTRSDIDKVAMEYRATIEELLYKSGIRV